MKEKLPFRQIHLDFHTSEMIEDVGAQFDAEEFAETLVNARVNMISLFTHCHHGNLYYDSKLFPERIHPHLSPTDLFREQTKACRKRGIKVNLYTSVCWNIRLVREHPEWVALDENGRQQRLEPGDIYQPGFHTNLCINHDSFKDFMKQHIGEILEDTEVDGVWLDGFFVVECNCPACQASMRALGMEPAKKEDRIRHAWKVYTDFIHEMSDFIRSYNSDYEIFYNKGHVGYQDKPAYDGFSYVAVESLPAGWGYMDFPVTIRYTRTLGLDTVGMTSRFQNFWGDNHSFRNQAAMEFECFSSLAYTGKCNIGDQMDPSGRLNPYMYEIIGNVFRSVEEKEPWCDGATALSQIGVFNPEEIMGGEPNQVNRSAEGICRMLQEAAHQFDFIDSEADFDRYELLILPDCITLTEGFAQKLEAYILHGGRVIATYESGLSRDKNTYLLPSMGIRYLGDAPYNPDFIMPNGPLGKGLPPTEHVMYLQGSQIESVTATVLEDAVSPLFNTTYEHFTGHMHAPSSGRSDYPAVTQQGNCIYFAHPLAATYSQYAPLWVKKQLLNAIDLLLPRKLLRHDGPSSILATVNEQRQEKRLILHLLHYIPQRRSQRADIIEEAVTLHGLHLELSCPQPVKRAEIVPAGRPIPFTQEDGVVLMTVDVLDGHAMIALTYE